jgi:hypothetical protein
MNLQWQRDTEHYPDDECHVAYLGEFQVGTVLFGFGVWDWDIDTGFAEFVTPGRGKEVTLEAAQAAVQSAIGEWVRRAGLRPVKE